MKVREDYAFPDLRIGQGQSECTTRSRGATSRAPCYQHRTSPHRYSIFRSAAGVGSCSR